MHHRAHVGIGEKVNDVILAGFHIDLDLGKAGDIRKRAAVVRVLVFRGDNKPLARKPRHCGLGHLVDVGSHIVAVVDAAQLNGALGRLREAQARAAALAEYALVGNFIIFRLAARLFSRRSPSASACIPSATAYDARLMVWVVVLPPDAHV